MRALALLLFIYNVQCKITIYLTDTPIQRIGPRIYKKVLLTNQYRDPVELAYDSATRNLYFMYMDASLQNSGRAFINVITKEGDKIEGIRENKATAVDPDTGIVYFGSKDGLYVYDPILKRAKNVGLYNVNINKLVIKNNVIYLIDANDHMIYKYNGRNAVRFGMARTVMDFEIDGEGNVYFTTLCGVFCAVGGDEIVKNENLSVAYNFIIDGNKAYAIAEDVLYELSCENGTATKVSNLDFRPRSLTFGDYGDIYYSDSNDMIFRLKPITSYVVYNMTRKKHDKS